MRIDRCGGEPILDESDGGGREARARILEAQSPWHSSSSTTRAVLHPAPLRDLLIRIAHTGVVHARWSERIPDECFRSILAGASDLKPEALARTRELMNDAVSDCRPVEGFENLIAFACSLPDLDDRHVLAAAIRAGAQVIVTTFACRTSQPMCSLRTTLRQSIRMTSWSSRSIWRLRLSRRS